MPGTEWFLNREPQLPHLRIRCQCLALSRIAPFDLRSFYRFGAIPLNAPESRYPAEHRLYLLNCDQPCALELAWGAFVARAPKEILVVEGVPDMFQQLLQV